MLWETSCSYSLVLFVLLEHRVTAIQYKVILTDHLEPIIFILMGVVYFENDSTSIYEGPVNGLPSTKMI